MVRTLRCLLFLHLTGISLIGFSQSEPSNHVTGFTVTAISSTEINLAWTDAAGPTSPEFYLIVGRVVPTGTFASVADGPEVPADADWSDGNFAAIVAFGAPDNLSVTGLDTETQYEFAIYSYRESAGNANYKIGGQPTESDYTFSAEPSGHSTTFTATLSGTTTIDLAFDAANTLTNADGYLLYRRAGSTVNLSGLNDGTAPPDPLNGAILVTTTSDAATAYSDAGLEGGITYHYALVPFNFDGTNAATYNFRNDGSAPQASATTTLVVTLAQLTGGVAADPLNSGSSNQAILGFSITTNGPVTFNALNVPVTTTPVGKFLNPRVFRSTNNNSFDGGDVSINTGTLTGTQIQFTGIGEALATSGTYNFFVVVNIAASVNSSTPSIQPSFTQANITFISPAVTAGAATITGTDYSFVDATPPNITFSPTNGLINFSAVGNITITFDEPIRKTDDSPITSADIEGGLVELKLNNDGGASVPFTGSINGSNTIITINPNATLLHNQLYYVEINPVEDANDNATSAQSITFTTEDRPAITTFSPLGGTCIGDNVTVTGARFTGTGNPLTGNTKPTVMVNGVVIPDAYVSPTYSATSVTFTLPPGSTTGPITIRNNDSDLVSLGSSNLNVFPAMNLGIPVTPATTSPAQNTSVAITIDNTQDNNYTYSLIANSVPGGYTATTQTTTGNNGTRTLTTTPALSQIGDYTYRIDVSRSNCTTRTLSNTPFTLTVSPLSVTVTATKTTICAGESIILIGATSGGTGFVQFRWTSTPPGFSSTNSSPTVSPTSDIRYNLEVEDNAGNIVNGFVDIVVNPLPTAQIVPNLGETSVRTTYVIEDRNYLITGSPAGGVFTGQGTRLESDGNYYFNPLSAGVNSSPGWPITYTYTDGNGCSNQNTVNFIVNNAAITNLELSYCRNISTGAPQVTVGPLSPNSTFPTYHPVTNPTGWQFTKLVFYAQLKTPPYTYCIAEGSIPFPNCGLPNPLSVNSTTLVQDISQPPGVLFAQPVSYTLNLDIVRNFWGYSTNYWFYILAYGRNTSGLETYITFQPFDVLDNGPLPSITGINENENVCSDGTVISLGSSENGYPINNFTITPATFIGSLSGTNNKDFNPGHPSLFGANERALMIQMLYRDFNNCPNIVSRNFNWVKKPETPIASNVDYCQIPSGPGSSFLITASPNGPATNPNWYNLDPASNPSALKLDSINFLFTAPGVTGLTPTIQTFYVSQSNKGCEGDAIPVTIEIKPAPNATFTVPSICENQNFTITGPTDSGIPYAQYDWSFGDTQTSTLFNNNVVTYNYGPNTGNIQYTIGLVVTTDRGCINSSNGTATVGINPAPEFVADYICEDDLTLLTATVTNVTVDAFQWNFGDGSPMIGPAPKNDPAPEGGTYQEPRHKFLNGSGIYNVSVTAFSPIGCNSTKVRQVRILDTLNVATSYRMANLDAGQGYWRLEDIAGNSTWQFNTPTTSLFSAFASDAWVTNPIGPYNPGERSFVNSPCITFPTLQRPAISLDYMFKTPGGVDGAVLEYSQDGGITWSSLGNIGTGLNWFNTTGFLLGNIGSSPVGWSDTTTITSVLTGRHALDFISNKNKTRFRIAFASGPGDKSRFEGFAFNNVVIESRNRNLLAENFTQEDPGFSANNTAFNNLTSSDGVKIQYHIGFPGNDNLHLENTADPNSRVAFYGITNSTGLVPRAYIDGYSNGTFAGSWNQTYRNLRSLVISPVSLSINTQPRPTSDTLQFTVTVTPSTGGIPSGQPILHAVIIEKIKGSNHSVVRKMLPNAAGRQLVVPVTAGTYTYKWRPEISFDPAQIAIVAFVQDAVTKEVYQAAELLNPNPAHLPDALITAIEDPAFAEKIDVYPNPASHELNILLPEPARSATPFMLIDAHGRSLVAQEFSAGQQMKTINTSQLAGGMYILQIKSQQGTARKKVMIVHGR